MKGFESNSFEGDEYFDDFTQNKLMAFMKITGILLLH